MWMTMNQDRIC